jgi:hypothetical protein
VNPINGFFEYGIMAILGGVGMVGFAVWTLSTRESIESEEIPTRLSEESSESLVYQYKKAA